MVFSSHMCPKLIKKGLKIDLGDQAMLRGVFEAGLELIWAFFWGQIDTFWGPGRLKMGPLELEPCSPATLGSQLVPKRAACTPGTGPRGRWRRPNGYKLISKGLENRSKIAPKSLLKLGRVQRSAKLDFEDPFHVFSWFSPPTRAKNCSKKL